MSDAARRSNGCRIFFLSCTKRPHAVGRAEKTSFALPFSQEVMADVLGLSVPHLNRMLTKLRAEGLIAVNDRYVEFADLNAVQLLAQFQPVRPARIPVPAELALV